MVKLDLDFGFNAITFGPKDCLIKQIDSFAELVDLQIRCFDKPCHELFSSLDALFPNVTKLEVDTLIHYDSWSGSILKLRKLKEVHFYSTRATRRVLYDLISGIAKGTFPKIRKIRLPDLSDNIDSNISLENFVNALNKCITDHPSIEFSNLPKPYLLFDEKPYSLLN